jgi:hypothetical protein
MYDSIEGRAAVCVGKVGMKLEVLNRWSPKELDWPVASYTVGDGMSFEAMQLGCRIADQEEATSEGVLLLNRKDFGTELCVVEE